MLAGLSRTRPQRRSAKRAERPPTEADGAAPTPPDPLDTAADTATSAPSRPVAPAAATAATPKKPAAKKPATKARSTAKTGAKPAAKPRATARPGTKAAAPASSGPARKPGLDTAKQPAVEVGRRAHGDHADAPQTGARKPEPVSGTELLAQAIHAADEVARFGVGVARSVLSRLPRP